MAFRQAVGLAVLLSCTALTFADEKAPVVCEKDASLQLFVYSNAEIEPYLTLLDEWSARAFSQYPYLWVPTPGEPCLGNLALVSEKDSLLVMVKREGEVVGYATGVPLDSIPYRDYLTQKTVDAVQEKGFDVSKMFYVSTFLTAPQYHNDPELVHFLYDHFAAGAASMGKTQLCYFEDLGSLDHPLRPENPVAIEPWRHVIEGLKSMDVQVVLSWPTLQSDQSVRDEGHTVDFFVKDLE